jgi:hypothetical protein
MRRPAAFIFFLLLLFRFNAQVTSNKQARIDSLKKKFSQDSAHIFRFKKFRPLFTIDNRNSFIREAPVNFRGIQLGLSYKDKHTVGLGAYKITQTSQRQVRSKDNGNRIVNQYLTLNYLTAFYQYTIIDKRYFELDLPIEIGLGNANIRFVDSLSQHELRRETLPIIPVGTGLQAIVKPFKWVGVSVLGGYRYVNEKGRNLNFNGWYYSFGLWLDVRQTYRDIKFYGFTRKKFRRQLAKIISE